MTAMGTIIRPNIIVLHYIHENPSFWDCGHQDVNLGVGGTFYYYSNPLLSENRYGSVLDVSFPLV